MKFKVAWHWLVLWVYRISEGLTGWALDYLQTSAEGNSEARGQSEPGARPPLPRGTCSFWNCSLCHSPASGVIAQNVRIAGDTLPEMIAFIRTASLPWIVMTVQPRFRS